MEYYIDPNIESALKEIFQEFESVFQAHQGGVEVVSASTEVITLRLRGKCEGCALAPLTFGLGIEQLIRERLPRVQEIRYTT